MRSTPIYTCVTLPRMSLFACCLYELIALKHFASLKNKKRFFCFSRQEATGVVFLDTIDAARYYKGMIKSFRDPETEKVYDRQYSRKLPHTIQRIAVRKLWMIDAASDLNDLRVPPSNHLERLQRLHGDRAGQHSIRVNDQWRVCFRWHQGDAYDIEVTDYH